MTLATRALPVRELAAQLSRPVATRSLLPLPRSTISRRSYSIGDKSKEKEPGGQRQYVHQRDAHHGPSKANRN